MTAIKPGVSLATSTVLRAGIVCVGAKLSAAQILALGWTTVPAAACSVGVGVAVIPRLAQLAGLQPKLGALLAAGTSICGVTAISAVAPAIGASQSHIAIAVANVVAFGSLGMMLYPHLAARLFPLEDTQDIGLFLGLAVHDTAQVMGCAASYAENYDSPAVVGAAAIAKLTRNVFLAAVVPLMAIRHGNAAAGGAKLTTVIPHFVGGFLAAAGLRTAGDAQLAHGSKALGLFDHASWKQGADWIGAVLGTKILLGTGLAGVGLSASTLSAASVWRHSPSVPAVHFSWEGLGSALQCYCQRLVSVTRRTSELSDGCIVMHAMRAQTERCEFGHRSRRASADR